LAAYHWDQITDHLSRFFCLLNISCIFKRCLASGAWTLFSHLLTVHLLTPNISASFVPVPTLAIARSTVSAILLTIFFPHKQHDYD
jgi:hypothetical protein